MLITTLILTHLRKLTNSLLFNEIDWLAFNVYNFFTKHRHEMFKNVHFTIYEKKTMSIFNIVSFNIVIFPWIDFWTSFELFYWFPTFFYLKYYLRSVYWFLPKWLHSHHQAHFHLKRNNVPCFMHYVSVIQHIFILYYHIHFIICILSDLN